MLKSILRFFFGLSKPSSERTYKTIFTEPTAPVQETLKTTISDECKVYEAAASTEEAPVKVKRAKSTAEKLTRNPRKPKTPTMSNTVETPKKTRKPKTEQTEASTLKPKRTKKQNSLTSHNS